MGAEDSRLALGARGRLDAERDASFLFHLRLQGQPARFVLADHARRDSDALLPNGCGQGQWVGDARFPAVVDTSMRTRSSMAWERLYAWIKSLRSNMVNLR
jgi:hypothetical protein